MDSAIYLLVFLVLSSVLCAQDKLYVFQKDGVFDFFPCEKIDSITFSRMDISGVLQSDFVTQQIHLSDTTYSIPLSSIDSVTYHAPETIFKANVIRIEDNLLPNVIRVESSYLLLSENTPKNLLPQTDEILIYGKQTDLFPEGFAGKVLDVQKEVDGWHVTYLIPGLDEIYERFFYADYISLDDEDVELQDMEGNPIEKNIRTRSADPTLKYSIETDNLTVTFGLGMAIEVKHDFNGEYSYVDVQLIHSHTFDIEAALEGKIFEKREDKPFFQLIKPIEMSGCLLTNKLQVGGFIEGSGAVVLNASAHYEEKYATGFNLTKTKGYIPYNWPRGKNKFDLPVAKLSMKGSLFAGISVSYGFGLVVDLKNKPFGIQLDMGPKLDADLTLGELNRDPLNFYSNNKSSSLTFSLGGKLTESIPEWAKKMFDIENDNIPAHDLSCEIYKWDLLPDFTLPEVSVNEENGTAVIQTNVSGNLLVPTTVGLALYKDGDLENAVVENGGIYNKDYHNPMRLAFQNLEKGTTYKIRPILNLFNHSILGDQITEFTIKKEEEPEDASYFLGVWDVTEYNASTSQEINKGYMIFDSSGSFHREGRIGPFYNIHSINHQLYSMSGTYRYNENGRLLSAKINQYATIGIIEGEEMIIDSSWSDNKYYGYDIGGDVNKISESEFTVTKGKLIYKYIKRS